MIKVENLEGMQSITKVGWNYWKIITLSLTGQVIHLKENGQPISTYVVRSSIDFCSHTESSSSSRFGTKPPILSHTVYAVSAVKYLWLVNSKDWFNKGSLMAEMWQDLYFGLNPSHTVSLYGWSNCTEPLHVVMSWPPSLRHRRTWSVTTINI